MCPELHSEGQDILGGRAGWTAGRRAAEGTRDPSEPADRPSAPNQRESAWHDPGTAVDAGARPQPRVVQRGAGVAACFLSCTALAAELGHRLVVPRVLGGGLGVATPPVELAHRPEAAMRGATTPRRLCAEGAWRDGGTPFRHAGAPRCARRHHKYAAVAELGVPRGSGCLANRSRLGYCSIGRVGDRGVAVASRRRALRPTSSPERRPGPIWARAPSWPRARREPRDLSGVGLAKAESQHEVDVKVRAVLARDFSGSPPSDLRLRTPGRVKASPPPHLHGDMPPPPPGRRPLPPPAAKERAMPVGGWGGAAPTSGRPAVRSKDMRHRSCKTGPLGPASAVAFARLGLGERSRTEFVPRVGADPQARDADIWPRRDERTGGAKYETPRSSATCGPSAADHGPLGLLNLPFFEPNWPWPDVHQSWPKSWNVARVGLTGFRSGRESVPPAPHAAEPGFTVSWAPAPDARPTPRSLRSKPCGSWGDPPFGLRGVFLPPPLWTSLGSSFELVPGTYQPQVWPILIDLQHARCRGVLPR